MTINELIEQLKNYPGDMRVLTLGYEGGYDDIDLKNKDIVFNYNSEDTWYYGPHETVDMVESHYGPHDYAGYDEHDDPNPGTKCVIIARTK